MLLVLVDGLWAKVIVPPTPGPYSSSPGGLHSLSSLSLGLLTEMLMTFDHRQ